jgi:hypothetical protein
MFSQNANNYEQMVTVTESGEVHSTSTSTGHMSILSNHPGHIILQPDNNPNKQQIEPSSSLSKIFSKHNEWLELLFLIRFHSHEKKRYCGCFKQEVGVAHSGVFNALVFF